MQGLQCPGGYVYGSSHADSSPMLEQGFMALPEDPMSVYFCVNGDTNCPGLRSAFVEDTSSICATHIDVSPRCSVCEEGYRKKDGVGCIECPETSIIAAFFRFVLSCLVHMVIIAYLYMRFNSPYIEGTVAAGTLLSFSQIVATVFAMPLRWPNELSALVDVNGKFSMQGSFSLFDFHLDCLTSHTFEGNLLFSSLTPLLLISMFGLLWYPAKFVFKEEVQRRPGDKPDVIVGLQWPKVANTVSLILQSFFVAISGMTLSMFSVELMPNGKLMTKRYPEIEYGSSRWAAALPISICAFLLYNVTFFAYCVHATVTAPKRAAEEATFKTQFRFMIGVLRPDCWWWSLIALSYFFLINIVQTLSGDVYVSLYLSVCVSFCFTAIEIYVQPFNWIMCNRVDIASKVCTVMILVFCTSFIDEALITDAARHRSAFGICIWMMIFSAFAFALVMIIRWVHDYFRPPGCVSARVLQQANVTRNIFALVVLLDEKDLVARLHTLQDHDLKLLDRCSRMLLSTLLHLQPDNRLFRQRIMPDTEFKIWDPSATEEEALVKAESGEMLNTMLHNAAMRCRINYVGSALSAELDAMQSSTVEEAIKTDSDLFVGQSTSTTEMSSAKSRFGAAQSLAAGLKKSVSRRQPTTGLKSRIEKVRQVVQAAMVAVRGTKDHEIASFLDVDGGMMGKMTADVFKHNVAARLARRVLSRAEQIDKESPLFQAVSEATFDPHSLENSPVIAEISRILGLDEIYEIMDWDDTKTVSMGDIVAVFQGHKSESLLQQLSEISWSSPRLGKVEETIDDIDLYLRRAQELDGRCTEVVQDMSCEHRARTFLFGSVKCDDMSETGSRSASKARNCQDNGEGSVPKAARFADDSSRDCRVLPRETTPVTEGTRDSADTTVPSAAMMPIPGAVENVDPSLSPSSASSEEV
jgi:hypothetical protein